MDVTPEMRLAIREAVYKANWKKLSADECNAAVLAVAPLIEAQSREEGFAAGQAEADFRASQVLAHARAELVTWRTAATELQSLYTQARAAAIEEAAKFVRKHPSITFDEDADKVAVDMLAALTSEPRSAPHREKQKGPASA